MKIFEKLIRRTKHFVEDPEYMLGKLICRIIPNRHIPDKLYLKVLFRGSMGYKLDLRHPKTFNEKLQWLKLHDRNPLYTTLVDKYRVKQWVADKIGEEYIIPTLAVYQSVDEIDLDKLPNQFVLKCNHDSGSVIICRDKATFDLEAAKAKLQKGLNTNYYDCWREWPYKSVPRRIIVEEYFEDENGELRDYKFFCFDGFAHSVMLCYDRVSGNPKFYFFDRDWHLLRLNIRGKNAPKDFIAAHPNDVRKMFDIADYLSKGFPFVRVDFYNIKEKIYFGEFTFYPAAGIDPNLLPETDKLFGDLIRL